MRLMKTRHFRQSGLPATKNPIRLTRFSLFVWLCLTSNIAWTANQKPVAQAGEDLNLGLGATAVLDASTSHDKDGQILKYRWQQTKGTKVALIDAQTPIARFVTPSTMPTKIALQKLTFKLTITDNGKKTASDNVVITLKDCSQPRTFIDGECREPLPVCSATQVLQDNRCVTPTKPLSCAAPLIVIDGACRLPPITCTLPQTLQNGICSLPVPHANLNDTGITSCSDTEHNGKRCPLNAYPGQDAEFGRDVYVNDNTDGHAGFSFKKIAANGSTLADDASDWSCLQDRVTGLIWEIKRIDGLHATDKLFSHSQAIEYVSNVNTEAWCGSQDWRLPTADELQMIVDYGVLFPGPAIDQTFFPNTSNLPHWTNTTHAHSLEKAWVVAFDDGRVFDDVRSQRYSVRLVHEGVKP